QGLTALRGLHPDSACAPAVTWQLTKRTQSKISSNQSVHAFTAAPRGCAARRREGLLFQGGGRTFAAGLSRQGGEAEGSLIRVVPGRAGAALTKPGRIQYCQMGRVRRAWRKGVREEPVSLRPLGVFI